MNNRCGQFTDPRFNLLIYTYSRWLCGILCMYESCDQGSALAVVETGSRDCKNTKGQS